MPDVSVGYFLVVFGLVESRHFGTNNARDSVIRARNWFNMQFCVELAENSLFVELRFQTKISFKIAGNYTRS